MGIRVVIASFAFASAAMLSAAPAHARADNSKPGEEERLEARPSGSAASAPAKTVAKVRPEQRKVKKRYILM